MSSDYVRMTSRKRGVVSYKESSKSELSGEEVVEEWEVEGGGGGGGAVEEDNREAIERVIKKRVRGK